MSGVTMAAVGVAMLLAGGFLGYIVGWHHARGTALENVQSPYHPDKGRGSD